MSDKERNGRLIAALVSAGFASYCYSYFRDAMRAACACCNMGQWPFQLVRWLAATMVGLVVYYFLGLAISRRVREPKG
jgi:hypothetical protein